MLRLKIFRSSAFRLALVYVGIFSVSVLILFGFIFWSTEEYMVKQTDAVIDAEVAELAEQYRTKGIMGLSTMLAERQALDADGSSFYLFADPEYNPLRGNLERWPDVKENEEESFSFNLEGFHQDAPEDETSQVRARPFKLKEGVHLLVGREVKNLKELKSLIIETLIWGLAITGVLALAGGLMMGRSMVNRIEAINKTCREVMEGDLSRRMPDLGAGDDFGQLTENLNGMLDRIEALMAGVRQVSDNIAHDLRTPLARLRNRLELLHEKEAVNEDSRALLDQAVREADGLLSTFGALLRIGRIESRRRREGFKEVALDSVIEDVSELYDVLAEERSQEFEIRIAGHVKVSGDRDLLFQAFANILDNAIKYTPIGGRIFLGLELLPDGPRVTIADSGPGVPEEAREKIFHRFFRLEESRTTPGNGLGLSLVSAVISLHGISVKVEDNNPGLRVQLQFPQIENGSKQ